MIKLDKGSHDTLSRVPTTDEPCEVCLFEAYNLLRPLSEWEWFYVTDACPADVSEVLWTFGISLNDMLSYEKRQQLKRYLPNGESPLADTHADERDRVRTQLIRDWSRNVVAPMWQALHDAPKTNLDSILAGYANTGIAQAVNRSAKSLGDTTYGADQGPTIIVGATQAYADEHAGFRQYSPEWYEKYEQAETQLTEFLASTVAAMEDSAIHLFDTIIHP
jgi:hypothetical protein